MSSLMLLIFVFALTGLQYFFPAIQKEENKTRLTIPGIIFLVLYICWFGAGIYDVLQTKEDNITAQETIEKLKDTISKTSTQIENLKIQNADLSKQVRSTLYPIDPEFLSFKIGFEIKANNKIFGNYSDRLYSAIKEVESGRKKSNWLGASISSSPDMKKIYSISFSESSKLWPNKTNEKFANTAFYFFPLKILVFKANENQTFDSLAGKQNDLAISGFRFYSVVFYPDSNIFKFQVAIDNMGSKEWNQSTNGGFASLFDLENSVFVAFFSDDFMGTSDKAFDNTYYREAMNENKISWISLTLKNKPIIIANLKLRKSYYNYYYFKFPNQIDPSLLEY